jgi:DNA invertase Pin-like site-specific DNA recombinase
MRIYTIETMMIGYARVSTVEQNEQLQTDALTKAGCERLFTDHASGAKAHRPELDHLLDTIRKGDTLIVWKLDRLGRSVQNLVDLMTLLQSRGVGFKSLTENMDTTTPGGVLIFNVFAAMAQFERDLIRERTNAGLQAARARGHKGGRPSKLSDRECARISELYQSRTLTVQEIADQYHVSRKTIYSSLKTK